MSLDFELQEPGWQRVLEALPAGSELPVSRFFALLGPTDEQEAQDAIDLLRRRDILLNAATIPVPETGEAAQRLKLEWELAHSGRLPGGLEVDDPLRQYWVQLERLPRLTGELAEDACPNDLLEGLMWLVLEEAHDYAGRGVLLADLLQEGAMGLLTGLEFTRSPLQLRRYIDYAMSAAVVLQALATGEGDRLMASMRAYQQTDRRLLEELGRNPTPEELAQAMGKTPEELQSIAKLVRDAAATPKQASQPQEPEEEPESVEDSPFFQLRATIEELLSRLDETDRQILTLRFGLENHAPQTAEQTARSLNLTESEVTAREAAAIALLRT